MSEVRAYPFVAADQETAAAAVGLGRTTLQKAQDASELIAHYAGTKPVYLARDLEAWIESLPTERPAR